MRQLLLLALACLRGAEPFDNMNGQYVISATPHANASAFQGLVWSEVRTGAGCTTVHTQL